MRITIREEGHHCKRLPCFYIYLHLHGSVLVSCVLRFITNATSRTDPCSPRVRAMMEGYDCYEFGADEHFGDVVVYVRRPKTFCRDDQ